MKIVLYYYIVSGGDGSASPRFFSTKKLRDAYMKAEEDSPSFEGFCDADGQIEINVDSEGKMTSPNWSFDKMRASY